MLILAFLIAGFVVLGLRAHSFDAATVRRLLAFVVTVLLLDLVREVL